MSSIVEWHCKDALNYSKGW